MKTYSILELDYSTQQTKEEITRYAEEHFPVLHELLKSDPILSQLTQNQKNTFLAFVTSCHAIAMHSHTEISVALHPDTNEASAVILAKEIELKHPMSALLATAISLSNFFAIEPDREDASKLVIFLNVSLFQEVEI